MGLAVLVAGDDVAVLQVLEQQLALGGLAGLLALQFDDLDGADAQGPARGGGAFDVVAREAGLRGAAELGDGQEGDFQLAAARVGGSTDQIFSML